MLAPAAEAIPDVAVRLRVLVPSGAEWGDGTLTPMGDGSIQGVMRSHGTGSTSYGSEGERPCPTVDSSLPARNVRILVTGEGYREIEHELDLSRGAGEWTREAVALTRR